MQGEDTIMKTTELKLNSISGEQDDKKVIMGGSTSD